MFFSQYPHDMMSGYLTNMEAICELAARLLFMSIKWTKNVPAFVSLSQRDQVLLLEQSWKDLLILNFCQFQLPPEALLTVASKFLKKSSTHSYLKISSNKSDFTYLYIFI